MSSIKIFTDSTCDLPEALFEQYDIGVVPLYVTFGEEAYKDGVEINPAQLYEQVEKCGSLPKTAAPSPADFIHKFNPYVAEGKNIIYIGLSSHLSSTIQNATIASQMLEDEPGNITVIDSLNLSAGIGQLVLRAARMAADGHSAEDIRIHVEKMRDNIESEFIIDTLDYLYKGGRCSGVQNLLGTLLKIRPVIKVIGGKMTPTNKIRGKREKALDQLLNNALSLKDSMDNDTMFVIHSFSEQDANYIKQQLEQQTGAKHVYLADTGCVISSHCGINTIGIFFAKKFS